MSAEKSLALPKASVKRIMKLSDEVQNVSAEAVIAVSKVTEDFLNQIVAQAHEVSQAHNRKTIKVTLSNRKLIALQWRRLFSSVTEFDSKFSVMLPYDKSDTTLQKWSHKNHSLNLLRILGWGSDRRYSEQQAAVRVSKWGIWTAALANFNSE